MPPIVRFGIDSSVELELSNGVLLAECGTPRGRSLDDPAGATARALAEPLDYPPLSKSTTPGDRVVVVLGQDVPQAPQIVGVVVRHLVESGVAPDGLTVLQTRSDAEAGNRDLGRRLPAEWRERIAFLAHDPAQRDRLAYLAASGSGEPILLSRAIVDADVVLPIGCMNRRKEAGRFGIHSAVFPTFSDRRTLDRFHSPEALEPEGTHKKRFVAEVAEVGWLLGVTFSIQVVPGGGDRVLHVLAGEVGAVGRRSRQLYREAWGSTVPRQATLVVAALEGGPAQQTWHNLGQALAGAAALVEEGGAIAVCCGLTAPPGPGMQRLAGALSRGATLRQIQKDRLEDALPATQLVEALDKADVYLLSGLDRTLVEELDMAPVADARELARLAGRHKSCILLANAHLAMVTIDE